LDTAHWKVSIDRDAFHAQQDLAAGAQALGARHANKRNAVLLGGGLQHQACPEPVDKWATDVELGDRSIRRGDQLHSAAGPSQRSRLVIESQFQRATRSIATCRL
jgi:hypothetical protein